MPDVLLPVCTDCQQHLVTDRQAEPYGEASPVPDPVPGAPSAEPVVKRECCSTVVGTQDAGVIGYRRAASRDFRGYGKTCTVHIRAVSSTTV
jgi:hypothetical protein